MRGQSMWWKARKIFEKLLQNLLTLSRYGYIIKTQKRKGERKNENHT